MSVKLVFLVTVVISMVLVLVSPSPIKEKEIDDIIFRLAEMKTELHLDGKRRDGVLFWFHQHLI